MTQQARNFCLHVADEPCKPRMVLRDNDGKYAPGFDAALKAEGIRPQPLTPDCPNLNAHAERFVQTLQKECLDHFIVFGERHLRHLVHEFVERIGEAVVSAIKPAERGEELIVRLWNPHGEAVGSTLTFWRDVTHARVAPHQIVILGVLLDSAP